VIFLHLAQGDFSALGARWFFCTWRKVIFLHLAQSDFSALGARWFFCTWCKVIFLHLAQGDFSALGERWFFFTWRKVIFLHLAKGDFSALGARWFFCTWVVFQTLDRSYCGLVRISLNVHSDKPHSAGLLWTSNRSIDESSTWQYTTLWKERYVCPRRDSDPQS